MAAGLIGRADEMDRLHDLVDGTGFAAVTGPGGIGKTALVDALVEEWRRGGCRAVEVRGTHGLRHVPLGALVRFLDVDQAEAQTATAAHLSKAIRGDADGPVLLSVDDAHLLDPASAGLVASLIGSDGVHVVVTARVPADAPRDIRVLWSRRPDQRLELGPLNTEAIAGFIEDTLGWTPAPDEVASVESTTLGYPLYLRALLAEADGFPTESGVTSARLLELTEHELAGVEGEPRLVFDVVALADSLDRSVAAVLAEGAVDQLFGLGLLQPRQGRVEIVHPLLGSVAVGSMSTSRRRDVVERWLAGALDSGPPGDVVAAVAEAVAIGVGIPPEATSPVVRAALASQAFDLVERLTRGEDAPDLQAARAVALRHLGEVPDPVVVADEAARLEATTARAQALAFVEGRPDEAVTLLSDTLHGVTDPAHRSRLAMELVVLSGLASDLDAMLVAARSVAASGVADPDTTLLAEAVALFAEGLTLTTTHAADTYRRGRAIVEAGTSRDPVLAERLEMSRVLVAFADGDLVDARHRCAAVEETLATGAWLTIESLGNDAWLPPAAAAARAAAAVDELARFDPLGNLPQASHLARLRAIQTGEDPAVDAPGSITEIGWRAAAIEEVMAGRVAGWETWRAGDAEAASMLTEAGRDAIRAGHRLWGVWCLVDAVRVGAGREVVGDLEELAVLRGSGLARLAALAGRATTPDEWWLVARSWWEAGAPNYAVEAAIRAGRDRPTYAAGAQLLAAQGATPVVGEVDGPLTDRPATIVVEVLAGRSNREIAERLFLSKRTVDNHLARAYVSTGLDGGRDQLIELFGWIGSRG